jgi:uncharacterized protein
MTTTIQSPAARPLADHQPKTIRWAFAQRHPLLTFLLIAFGWSWLFWFAGMPLQTSDRPLMTLLTLAGAYGPAVGGILTLGLKNGFSLRLSKQQAAVMAGAALLILGVMAVRTLTGASADGLPAVIPLNPANLGVALLICLLGGWVISSARSTMPAVRQRMASILPVGLPPLRWSLLGLLFFPVMLLLSWGMGALLGLGVEYPPVYQQPALEVLGLFFMAFLMTALTGGGLEEPGWRGMMLPELQARHTPLVASLIIALAWSLWHLPLYLNGFYSGDLVGGMIGSGIYRILLALFLTWYYNRSGGSLFWIIILHTMFNMAVNFLPLSDAGMLVLWLAVVVWVVWKGKMVKMLPASE